MTDFDQAREDMVTRQLAARGIADARVLAAMRAVRREAFVPDDLRGRAYDDGALPLGEGQTISQPYIVALMAEAATIAAGDRVLEVGTGSGYGAAVLAHLAAEVHSVERLAPLAADARERLRRQGCDNVRVHVGDGTRGWPPAAPFDAIVVTAGGPRVPAALRRQLAVGGRLVIPIGAARTMQTLLRITRIAEADFAEADLGPVAFVPLVGENGWEPEPPFGPPR